MIVFIPFPAYPQDIKHIPFFYLFIPIALSLSQAFRMPKIEILSDKPRILLLFLSVLSLNNRTHLGSGVI